MQVLLIVLSDWKVTGRENVPRQGAFVLVANHQNNIDPPLISASLPRPVVFMAKQELFENPLMRMLVKGWGAFPVRRGEVDRKALRLAEQYVRNGYALGMFPEGKRSSNGELQEAHSGAAHLAWRSDVPVLPIGITGTGSVKGLGSVLRRPTIRVNIGQPFKLTVKEGRVSSRELSLMTEEIMLHVAELLPETSRGRYRNQATHEFVRES